MADQPSRRAVLQGALASLSTIPVLSAIAAGGKKPRFPFYAMDTGLVGADVRTLEAKVELLKKLGYSGIGYTLNHTQLPQLLTLLDKNNLQLWAVYTTPSLEGKVDPHLAESIRRMKGRPTRIETAVTSRKFKSSDPAGDRAGIDLLKAVSDMAADSGPVVSVYPHKGFWTERAEDGLRLAEKIKRKNVGTHFNLVHWKWTTQKKPLKDLLGDLLPHLFCVTVNGLDNDAIVSLEQGNYDIDSFMALVKKVGYRGPVGLQGYSVRGLSGEHLKRSMKKWQSVMKELAT